MNGSLFDIPNGPRFWFCFYFLPRSVVYSFAANLTISRPAMMADKYSMTNTKSNPPISEMYPVIMGPIAAPMDPIPSMMAVTVARALELPWNHQQEGCGKRDDAVMIK